MRDAVVAAGASDAEFFAFGQRPGHFQFDLRQYCAVRLARAGVAAVAHAAADTAAEPERFFSHRRRTLNGGGPIGHQISVVTLRRGPAP